jgi:hypothetical protein
MLLIVESHPSTSPPIHLHSFATGDIYSCVDTLLFTHPFNIHTNIACSYKVLSNARKLNAKSMRSLRWHIAYPLRTKYGTSVKGTPYHIPFCRYTPIHLSPVISTLVPRYSHSRKAFDLFILFIQNSGLDTRWLKRSLAMFVN